MINRNELASLNELHGNQLDSEYLNLGQSIVDLNTFVASNTFYSVGRDYFLNVIDKLQFNGLFGSINLKKLTDVMVDSISEGKDDKFLSIEKKGIGKSPNEFYLFKRMDDNNLICINFLPYLDFQSGDSKFAHLYLVKFLEEISCPYAPIVLQADEGLKVPEIASVDPIEIHNTNDQIKFIEEYSIKIKNNLRKHTSLFFPESFTPSSSKIN